LALEINFGIEKELHIISCYF